MNTDIDTIFETKNTEGLVALYAAYCAEHALPHIDATELFHELWDMIREAEDLTLATQYAQHIKWVAMFIAQWDAVQDREDAERECKRNGHRDTGRGVCADCGAFI